MQQADVLECSCMLVKVLANPLHGFFTMNIEQLRSRLIQAVEILQTSSDPIERQQAANQLKNFINDTI